MISPNHLDKLQAYKNHWVLRTSPDDWFFPVIRRIAQVGWVVAGLSFITLTFQVVDDNAFHPEVRNH